MAIKFRSMAKKSPILWMTPLPLETTEASRATGTKLSNDGYEFEVPWKDLETDKVVRRDNIAAFVFRSGIGITYFGLRNNGGLISLLQGRQAGLGRILGEDAVQSDYALQKATLDQTPGMLTPWISRRDAARISTLLNIKLIDEREAATGIFRLEINGWKGFQFGDPARKPNHVTLNLYDSQYQHVRIIFARAKDAQTEVTQLDINRVVQTLRKATGTPSSAGR
jgi:hypothetical protein